MSSTRSVENFSEENGQKIVPDITTRNSDSVVGVFLRGHPAFAIGTRSRLRWVTADDGRPRSAAPTMLFMESVASSYDR